MSVTVDLDYLYKALFAVTFGPSRQAQRIVESHLERKYPGAQHLAFEYFVHCPLNFQSEPDALEEQLENALSCAPFLPRIASGSLSLPNVDQNGKLEFTRPNERTMAEERFWVPFKETNFSQLVFGMNRLTRVAGYEDLLKFWRTERVELDRDWIAVANCVPPGVTGNDGSLIPLHARLFEGEGSATNPRSRVVALATATTAPELRKALERYLKQAQEDLAKTESRARIAGWSRMMQYGFLRSRLGWLFADVPINVPMLILLIPIASDCLFYGFCWYLVVGVPTEKLSDENEERRAALELAADLSEDLLRHATDSYTPSLAVLHQHLIERSIKNTSEPGANFNKLWTDSNYVMQCKLDWKDSHCDLKPRYFLPFRVSGKSAFIVEKALCAFWERTAPRVAKGDEPPWLFREYVVASDKMVKTIQDLCSKSEGIRRSGTSLPSALVVGGPGSGKEQVANILSRLSSQFWAGEIHKINLAALKPDALAAPSLMGLEQGLKLGDRPQQVVTVSGLFRRIRAKAVRVIQERLEHLPYDKWDSWLEEVPVSPTVVLDELNSLGIESQGVLLRLLENAEIVAVGAVDDARLSTEAADGDPLKPGWWRSIARRSAANRVRTWWDNRDRKQKTNFFVVGVMNEDPDELTRERAMSFLKEGQYLGGFLTDLLYEQFVRLQRLRPDIKYRLMRGGYFVLPNLDERREDLPILFMFHAQNELRSDPKYKDTGLWVTQEAYDALISERVRWPGNVRQLQEVVKTAVHLASTNPCNQMSPGVPLRQFIVLATNIRDAVKEPKGGL